MHAAHHRRSGHLLLLPSPPKLLRRRLNRPRLHSSSPWSPPPPPSPDFIATRTSPSSWLRAHVDSDLLKPRHRVYHLLQRRIRHCAEDWERIRHQANAITTETSPEPSRAISDCSATSLA